MIIASEVMGKNIGKLVASSKRMIKWGLIINMKKVEIMLKHSIVSGKRMIRVNEVVVHESRGVGDVASLNRSSWHPVLMLRSLWTITCVKLVL